MLARLVEQGKLPPEEERLPKEPLVVELSIRSADMVELGTALPLDLPAFLNKELTPVPPNWLIISELLPEFHKLDDHPSNGSFPFPTPVPAAIGLHR
ncbi:MAG: hypothetical protein GX030_05790 [Firmicutes bacterium]|nr:hypothetical protein [Bacillota bacterium]